MGLVAWGIGLIVLGVIVSLLLPGEPGSLLVWLGWILLGIGVVLALLGLLLGARAGRHIGRSV